MRKKIFAVIIVVFALAGSVLGSTTWTNGTTDGKWTTADNWSAGLPNYTPGNDAFIGNAGVGDCTLDANGSAYRIRVGIAEGAGTLRITDGTLETRYFDVGYNTNVGTVYQTGGLVQDSTATYSYLGVGGGSSPGYYYMSGGTLNLAVIWMASYAGSSGYMLQTGGVVSPGGYYGSTVECGCQHSSTCEYEIRGGTLAAGANGDVTVGSYTAYAGTGTFHVAGSASTITIGGNYLHYAKGTDGLGGGTLKCGIDGSGITLIQVAGNATFNEGSILDMYLLGAAPAPNTPYNLLTAQGTIDISGLSLSPEDVGVWTFAVVSGGSETLQATYVPEPATLALLGLGGLGVLLRRRRRA